VKYLYENQNIKDEHKELKKHIKNSPSLHKYFESNFNDLKPKNYCGFLSIDNESYFIIPKISDKNTQNLNTFIYMLMYAYDINLKNEELMCADNQEHQIFELFIRLFSDALLDEFKRGVFKQYITMQENLKVLRGKYIIEKNFNNFYHQNIYCEFDEFSMDNELNRFFLYAIRTFKKFSSYGNLHRCEAVLDEVDYFNVDFKRFNIHFDRMNSRYKKSYEVALMILQKLVPMTQKSTDKSFAFLFDMAEVFEKFVGRMYGEIDSSTQLQVQRNFGSLVLKPDIMTETKIIDTKYKKVNDRSDLSVQDKYQMFAYGVNFKVKDTMLLYPKHLVDVNDHLELGKGDELVRLEMRSLDLGFDGGFDEYINEIKNKLEIRL
jgi:5-methylcytosine-specific restriction enzyme subunit McrC